MLNNIPPSNSVLNSCIPSCNRFADKEVQRDAKLVSYDIVDKDGKPYVQVDVQGQAKVCGTLMLLSWTQLELTTTVT
jgi:hypothetical protein